MIHSIHVAISIFLVMLHTSILHSHILYNSAFVMFLSFLMYLACFRTLREGLPPLFLAGFLMDSFSGGPFGLFTSTYFWIFALVRFAAQFLRLQNPHTIRLLIFLGVILENGILLSTQVVVDGGIRFTREMAFVFAGQIGLAVWLGPFLFRSMSRMLAAVELWGRVRTAGAAES